jgi:cytochrome c-type biogenesis protein CcmH/NrfG
VNARERRTSPGAAPARRRRLFLLALALLIAAAAGFGLRARFRTAEPPAPDLSGSDPGVRAAVEAASARVREQPRSVEAWGELGMVLLANDFLAEARSVLARCSELAPSEARWPYLEALADLKGVPDPERAIAHLERAVKAGGRDPLPRLRLGELLLEHGRLDGSSRGHL